jgi:hypothetical protein
MTNGNKILKGFQEHIVRILFKVISLFEKKNQIYFSP